MSYNTMKWSKQAKMSYQMEQFKVGSSG